MTTYGVTPQGFVIKRLQDILNSLNAAAIVQFGVDFDTDPDKPNGQLFGILAAAIAEMWELAAAVYNAKDPANAQGVALTDLGVLNFLERISLSTTTVFLTLTGTAGTPIPSAILS